MIPDARHQAGHPLNSLHKTLSWPIVESRQEARQVLGTAVEVAPVSERKSGNV